MDDPWLPSPPVLVRYRTRTIGPAELTFIQATIAVHAAEGRTRISEVLCAAWDWRQPNGHLKESACRGLLLRLEERGYLILSPRRRAPDGPCQQDRLAPPPPPGPPLSAPPPGARRPTATPRAMPTSAGTPRPRGRACPSSPSTPASSSCPGCACPTWPPRSWRRTAAGSAPTGRPATGTAFAEAPGAAGRLGRALRAETDQLFTRWHRVRDGTLARASFRRSVGPLRRRVEALRWLESRCRPTPTAATCREILTLAPALWTFVRVAGMEPTNNAAERALQARGPVAQGELRQPQAGREPVRGTDADRGRHTEAAAT